MRLFCHLSAFARAGDRLASDRSREREALKPRICICCGEAMIEHSNALSRNPNICASCSSLVDGMDDDDVGVLGVTDSACQHPLEASEPIPVVAPEINDIRLQGSSQESSSSR